VGQRPVLEWDVLGGKGCEETDKQYLAAAGNQPGHKRSTKSRVDYAGMERWNWEAGENALRRGSRFP